MFVPSLFNVVLEGVSLDNPLAIPQQAFTFRANQDQSFNLQIEVYLQCTTITYRSAAGTYLDYQSTPVPQLVATGTLPLPDSPLYVIQSSDFMPGDVDLSQEPTFPFVVQGITSTNGSLATIPNTSL